MKLKNPPKIYGKTSFNAWSLTALDNISDIITQGMKEALAEIFDELLKEGAYALLDENDLTFGCPFPLDGDEHVWWHVTLEELVRDYIHDVTDLGTPFGPRIREVEIPGLRKIASDLRQAADLIDTAIKERGTR